MAKNIKSAFMPNYAIPRGETLKETIQSMGVTRAQVAQQIGRPKKTLDQIMQGKVPVTHDTAIQLERVLGVPACFWNNLERNYRETIERLRKARKR